MKVELVITDFLDRAVHLYGNKKAIIDEYGNCYTYRKINERVNRLSSGLVANGVVKGDRVAYLAPNTLEMYEGFYGVMQLGAVMVPLNTRLKPNEYVYILNHSESKILFVDYELMSLIEPILHELETVETIIVHGLTSVEKEFLAYDQWLAQQDPSDFVRPKINEDDIGSLLYTSGTTGYPKGVMLTHRNNYLHAMSAMHHLQVTDRDTLIHILPMFHVNGWGSPFYYTANGATQVMQRKVDSLDILRKIEQYGVTIMHMAPTVLSGIMNEYLTHKPYIKQKVRAVVAGAAPPQAFIKQLEEEVGWEFVQVYGMTELSPLITTSYISSEDDDLSGDAYYEAKAKVGYEMIGTRVRVVDEFGQNVVANGEDMGEIIVKGHGVMKGYWKDEQETNQTIVDGWLHTGDIGTIDERGRVSVVDRKKDIIISGGENISSIEVEGILYEHPAVKEAAIIAIPHEKWGETPHAMISLKEGFDASEQELIDFCRSRLAHFKCPKTITFMDELPKTASGKVLKVQLRELV